MAKSLLHSSTMSDVYLLNSGDIEKRRGSRPGSETILEREFEVLSRLEMERIPEVRGFDHHEKILTMSRVGTHDLSDVLHDVPLFTVPYIMRDFFSDLSKIGACDTFFVSLSQFFCRTKYVRNCAKKRVADRFCESRFGKFRMRRKKSGMS